MKLIHSLMMHALVRPAGLFLLLLAASCGGGSSQSSTSTDTKWPQVVQVKEGDVTPILVQSQIEIGDIRFAFALVGKDQEPILGAAASIRMYKIDGERGVLHSEFDAKYEGFDTSFVEQRDNGQRVTHVGPEIGVYTAPVNFDAAGAWGVIVTAKVKDKTYKDIPVRFNVIQKGPVSRGIPPAIGDAAPQTRQVTLSDIPDITQIDTSNPPHPEMHNITVADALGKGKPLVIAFATPAFCTSRTCGPVIDKVVVPLLDRYKDRVTFIHIEPYDVQKARSGGGLTVVPAMTQWGLQSEPWIFVIDKNGKVAGKFEGIMGPDEVAAVLDQGLK